MRPLSFNVPGNGLADHRRVDSHKMGVSLKTVRRAQSEAPGIARQSVELTSAAKRPADSYSARAAERLWAGAALARVIMAP